MEVQSAPPLILEKSNRSNFRSYLPKIIFALLGIILVIELYFAFKTFSSPITLLRKVAPITSGKISLIAKQNTFKVGDIVPVLVRISTGGHSTIGTDISVKFDPNFLEASGSANFKRGSTYRDYLNIKIDGTAGTIKVSGISSAKSTGFNGIGEFGGITFRALRSGKTTVALEYQPNQTILSNITEAGTSKNVLGEVYNLNLNIVENPSLLNLVKKFNSSCSSRTIQLCQDNQGRIGTYWCNSFSDPASCRVGCFVEKNSPILGCKVTISGKIINKGNKK